MNVSIFSKKLSDLSKGGVSLGGGSQNSPLKSSIARNQPMPSIGLKDTKAFGDFTKNRDIRCYDSNAGGVRLGQRQRPYPSANEGISNALARPSSRLRTGVGSPETSRIWPRSAADRSRRSMIFSFSQPLAPTRSNFGAQRP